MNDEQHLTYQKMFIVKDNFSLLLQMEWIYITMTWFHGHHQDVSVVGKGGASKTFAYRIPFKPFKNNSHHRVLCLCIKTQMVQQIVVKVLWDYYLVHFLLSLSFPIFLMDPGGQKQLPGLYPQM
jgi:hypothetical protein